MRVYAGIDEAGYGPLFGPLVVARSVFALPQESASGSISSGASPGVAALAGPVDLWTLLRGGVCRTLAEQRKSGRLAINDSKKLHSKSAGLGHLEAGCLSLARLAGCSWQGLDDWLRMLQGGAELPGCPPWYAAGDGRPWCALPRVITAQQLGIAAAMLQREADKAGVACRELGAAVVFEDRFNAMVAATRSKAAMSFTFVAKHLDAIWRRFGKHEPFVAVDRQSGRTHYRELLALAFPQAHLRILQESDRCSGYRLEAGERAMTVVFQVDGEGSHLPVAAASMTAKYTRELLMERFNGWFAHRLPHIRPTAGYGSDGKRFWREIQPHLAELGIAADHLRRRV